MNRKPPDFKKKPSPAPRTTTTSSSKPSSVRPIPLPVRRRGEGLTFARKKSISSEPGKHEEVNDQVTPSLSPNNAASTTPRTSKESPPSIAKTQTKSINEEKRKRLAERRERESKKWEEEERRELERLRDEEEKIRQDIVKNSKVVKDNQSEKDQEQESIQMYKEEFEKQFPEDDFDPLSIASEFAKLELTSTPDPTADDERMLMQCILQTNKKMKKCNDRDKRMRLEAAKLILQQYLDLAKIA